MTLQKPINQTKSLNLQKLPSHTMPRTFMLFDLHTKTSTITFHIMSKNYHFYIEWCGFQVSVWSIKVYIIQQTTGILFNSCHGSKKQEGTRVST